ncbi:lipid A biosynthesis acyltransferase [Tamlana agarivorans]|uniref:Lipid A biosynthesis acyltransferase n=1 Tax=Pseudotamlana agarivorans TaxID=481183 RepID=A0ACC5UAA5_9FLAO|nr:lipid A biosynthesis acyltransferase [Tamlana agarivorans]MBU2951252.1 lipid A biosynthesis acyltransferase [Tamlana agarivorans]
MLKEWRGKSRGTVFGYKIFVFCIKKLGLRSAYFVLYFVSSYFFFFAWGNTRANFDYFKKRQKFSTLKSILSIFKSYYVFGQTIIDKIAISSGLRDKFTYHFDGGELINETLKNKKGGILISAHVGNFEIAEHFFGELEEKAAINILTTDAEHSDIKIYLESVTSKPNVNLIFIQEDLSHIFEINAALARNELVCITGDRYVPGSKYLSELFFKEEAAFPAGPFLISSRLRVPVLFVYVMKETRTHYHLYTRKAEFEQRDAKALLKEYTESLSWILGKYPLQWFNYFHFWNTHKK